MPISLFSSPFGSLDLALMAGSPEAKDWLADLQGPEAPKWIWVVPSSRRRRAIVRNWPGAESGRSALFAPDCNPRWTCESGGDIPGNCH